MTINKKIKMLQLMMIENNIDTYIITKNDPHATEYAPIDFNSVLFISGFTGSNAIIAITQEEAYLWTDGRYFLQATKELNNTNFILQKDGEPGVKNIFDFVVSATKKNGVIGFDGKTLDTASVFTLIKKSKQKNILLQTDIDLVGEIWIDRSVLQKNKLFNHDISFAGLSVSEKIKKVKSIMLNLEIDTYVISSLDDIAWLLNLRGHDIKNNSSFISYAIIDKSNTILFVDLEKTTDVINFLNNDNILVKDYASIIDYIKQIKKDNTIAINPNVTNYNLYLSLSNYNINLLDIDIIADLKSCKNQIEVTNLKDAYIRDAAYLLRALKWIKENVNNNITEYDIGKKVDAFRSVDKNYICPSFDTIAGYMDNSALMHYKATEFDCKIIKNRGFLLLDSGAIYLDGTTDITRTFCLGEISSQMKKDFTLVLKAMIGLSEAIFLEGAYGIELDSFARKIMWDNHMDYKCGTGHGIGFCLNVHEGPQSISRRLVNAPLKLFMVTSNEPGVYRENEYGIRTENTILVVEDQKNQFGNFYKFETLSYFPIDINAIEKSMLTEKELDWINNYHKQVFDKLSPHLTSDETEFLKTETRLIF